MNLLLTGASGFVGSHLARAFGEAGHEVYPIDREFYGDLADLTHLPDGPLDEPFDAVVHAAARSPAPGVAAARMAHDNVAATCRLAELATAQNIPRFVFLSSVSAFGRISSTTIDESTPSVDPDPYGTSKLLCEQVLREAPFASLSLRLPCVLGRGASRHALARIADRLVAGEPVRLYNAHLPFNNAVHVDELAAFVLNYLGMPDPLPSDRDVVVLGSSHPAPFVSVVLRLARALDSRSKLVHDAASAPGFTIDSSRAVERWGYAPRPVLEAVGRYGKELVEKFDP